MPVLLAGVDPALVADQDRAPYGMAYLEAYLPAPEAQAAYGLLTETNSRAH